MSIWKRFLSRIGLRFNKRSRALQNILLRTMVSNVAKRESRPETEFVHELLAAGLSTHYSREIALSKWQSLTPRQQEVAVLIAEGWTNKQMAKHLSVSDETIKTHVANVLKHFKVKDRSNVRQMLAVMKRNRWI